MSCFPLYYHPLYSEGLDRSARFPVDRYRLLADRLSFLDLDGKIDMKLPGSRPEKKSCLFTMRISLIVSFPEL